MWINLEENQKIQLLEQMSTLTGYPALVIEKDWWVCLVLKAVFQSEYADSIIFKGGTSLSKAYQLVERFSEDIDLIVDRHLLGFDELNSKSQIKKLRMASGGFIINEFRGELIQQLTNLGIDSSRYEIRYNDQVDDTSDPNTLELHYQSAIDTNNDYIQKRVLLEVGARSLTEPSEKKAVISFIDKQFGHLPFALPEFSVQVVKPIRTFIEKTLLLHEEFSKQIDKIRTDRLTRHLYDLEKMMDTEHGIAAITDDELFNTIVEHRKNVTPIRGIDYSNHKKGKLKITPPQEVIQDWENDYKEMQQNMMAGESLSWNALIERIKEIERRFNKIEKE